MLIASIIKIRTIKKKKKKKHYIHLNRYNIITISQKNVTIIIIFNIEKQYYIIYINLYVIYNIYNY
jgi:hypothetical protein